MRMSTHAVWVLPLMLLFGAGVHAQCRIGSGPNHNDGIPWCSQLQQPAKRLPPVQWAEQWGAIAYGGGAFGAAREMATVNDAKNAALNACQDNGGGNQCRVALSYSNQCAAYALGDNYAVGVARSATSEDAQAMATETCRQSTTNCKVTYSACSLPVRVK